MSARSAADSLSRTHGFLYNAIMPRVYEEIVDFIAAGTTPAKVARFRPSAAARARLADLVRREKMSELSPDETAELNHFLQIEHIMRLAKARAHQHVPGD